MSLIHEALKKAEEQRRLGQPPDLASPFSRPRERQPLLPFLLVAIVIAGGVGWWLLRTPASTNSAGNAVATKASTTPPQKLAGRQDNAGDTGLERTAARSSSGERLPVAPPPPAPPSPVAPPAAATKAAPPNMMAPAKIATADPAAAPPGKAAVAGGEKVQPIGAPSDQAKPDPEALAQAMGKAAPVAVDTTTLNTATKPSGPTKVAKVPTPDTAPSHASPTASPTPTPGMPTANAPDIAAASPAPGAKKPEPSDNEPVTGPALNPPAPPTAAVPTENLPLFWQLEYSKRKELPQLNMSMHVFAADPGKRFIVINGDHKVEGDTIGADLYVREIRSDGVVMEFHGQRFLVPRGGS